MVVPKRTVGVIAAKVRHDAKVYFSVECFFLQGAVLCEASEENGQKTGKYPKGEDGGATTHNEAGKFIA